MYPLFRLATAYLKSSRQPPVEWHETHISQHMCLPWDIDPWGELNNGRTLTLYDIGRVGLTQRLKVAPMMKEKRWGFAIAGSTVRYRRRILMFDRFEMRTRISFWDERFFYFEQSLWKSNGVCASHLLARAAITSKDGIVPPQTFLEAYGKPIETQETPGWAATWIEAERQRPWPPVQEAPDTSLNSALLK